MAQNYQKIGDYISVLDNRNTDGSITNLMGISIDKCYIPSVANVIGTDLNNYKVIRKGQFACSLMQVSRDQRIPLAMYTSGEPAIMSPAYVMFEVNRPDELLPEYMELWFKRAEFDREASFYAVGGVRGSLDWEDFCKMKLPVPPISEQRKIVHDYQVITDRIELLRKINENLEEQAQTVYKSWFETYDPFGGEMPEDWFEVTIIMHETSLHSPTVVLITDRSDLDDQLSRQFLNSKKFIGDNSIIEMDSREQLKDLLAKTASGGVYLTTIQKFADEFGELSTRSNIICISDEAHRTSNNLDMKLVLKSDEVLKRYGFAKFLHTALPQATYIGFTGTPVDATMDVFGPVIDQYTMTDSVKDGITVRLVYDGRPARATLDDSKVQEIEEYYNQCLAAGSNQYQIDASKKAVTNMAAIVGDDDVLNAVADYFIDHYETRVREGSTVAGKAMFVCLNRPIAFKFYNILKEKRPEWFELKVAPDGVELSEQDKKELIPMPMCQFVATRSKDDPQDMYDLLGNDSVRKTAATQFKNIKSNFKIAIVVDLWLTGFDVPFLDTMYIDKPITQSHTIIQTVSRVNRSYAGKDSGLIVDFIGIKLGLLAALRNYTDFREDSFDEDSVQAAIRVVRNQIEVLDAMMHGFDNKNYFTGTPSEKLQCLNEAAEFIQKTKDLEQRFMSNVLRMSKAFNLCNSSKDFTKYELDLIHYYKAVRSILFKLTKGDAPDTDTMNAHVREMLEGAIQSEGVEEVFSTDTDVDAEAVDLFSEEYLERISRIKLPNTKVKILAQLLKKKVKEFKKVNKIKAVSFEDRLQAILDDYNNRMTDADYIKSILDNVADQLLELLNQLKEEETSFSAMGIDYEEKAFYDILVAVAEKFQFEYPDDKNIELAKEIRAALKDKEKYSDWANSMQIKALMQADIIMILAKHGYPPVPPEIYEKVCIDILEQTENFKKYSDD